jgi:hypothetical protein
MISDQLLQVNAVGPLGRNAIFRNSKGFEMEIDCVRKMALKIIEERASHIDDANGWVVHKRSQLRSLDESREV